MGRHIGSQAPISIPSAWPPGSTWRTARHTVVQGQRGAEKDAGCGPKTMSKPLYLGRPELQRPREDRGRADVVDAVRERAALRAAGVLRGAEVAGLARAVVIRRPKGEKRP